MGQYTGRALHELGLAILLAAVLAPFTVRGYNDTQECNSCSIYILDLSSFAHTRGYPICELDKVVVDPTTGVVYLREKDTGIAEKVGHQYGTHSAPWYLMKAIKASSCYVDDITKATAVFVYDYCYYIWWLAHIHSALGKKVVDTPGDYLIEGWSALLQLPRWQHNDGRDFVFYDSHPGFAQGNSAPSFLGMFCNDFRHATHIVVETAQRNVCQSFMEIRKMLITPYVPNVMNASNPWALLQQPSLPMMQRNLTVYFRGKCTPQTERYTGKKMRLALVKELGNAGNDTDIRCSEESLGGSHEEYAVAFRKMQHSIFCLVLPGDAQSTRRLSEIFLAGCIPVFLGPPYSTMPFADDVLYKSIGVFFNITSHPWLPKEMHWEVHPTERAMHGQEAQWWLPDADISSVVITERSFSKLMGHLRNMPHQEVARKLQEMGEERHKFHFQEKMDDPPNSLNIIIKRVCNRLRRRHAPIKQHREGMISPRVSVSHEILRDDGTGASTSLGKAWLKVYSQSGHQFGDTNEVEMPMGGAIRTRGSSWHPFSLKGGFLKIENARDGQSKQKSIPDLDLA